MKRLPLLPTLLVAIAVATMLGLGVWQLERRAEKEALLALYYGRASAPAVDLVRDSVDVEALRYRRANARCDKVESWQIEGGRGRNGSGGYRHIAVCLSAKPAFTFLVDYGVSADPKQRPAWRGGLVSGVITEEPQHFTMLERMIGILPAPHILLISNEPAPGLRPSAQPSPEAVPNNHLFYAFQWFFFAGAAAVIYLLALRRRSR